MIGPLEFACAVVLAVGAVVSLAVYGMRRS
jgi:hypothetical protein